jgi:hypothetical protein
MLTAMGFTIGAVTCGGFPMPGPSKRLTPYVVSPAILSTAHVPRCHGEDSEVFLRTTHSPAAHRGWVFEDLERTKIEQKL